MFIFFWQLDYQLFGFSHADIWFEIFSKCCAISKDCSLNDAFLNDPVSLMNCDFAYLTLLNKFWKCRLIILSIGSGFLKFPAWRRVEITKELLRLALVISVAARRCRPVLSSVSTPELSNVIMVAAILVCASSSFELTFIATSIPCIHFWCWYAFPSVQ